MFKAFYIDYNNYSAAFNMAADFFIHKKSEIENSCFLRFYGWKKKTITLGRFQKTDFLKENKYTEYDKALRMSGGRAVFHEYDLTYCFTAPLNMFDERSLKSTYKIISKPFIQAFERYGINIEVSEKPSKDYSSRQLCFSSVSLYELNLNGKKLLGSAQYRSKDVLSQHGTMYYGLPDIYNENEVPTDIEICPFIREKSFRDIIVKRFENVFDIKFEDYSFTHSDIQEIIRLSGKFIIE